MKGDEAALIWCPFGSGEDARLACETLLHENLIACANIIPQIISLFSWQDEIHTADEVAVLLKTSAEKLEEATQRLAVIHPYEVPAIAGWVADQTPRATAQWLVQTTLGKGT